MKKKDIFLGNAVQPTDQQSFDNLGIKKEGTEIWEDALRTSGENGTMEWWYADAEFDDGTTVVTMFYTKYMINVKSPAHPTATIVITYPDGSEIKREISEKRGQVMRASKEKCDANVNDSYIKYVNGNYEVFFKDGDLEYKATMKSSFPMWRPNTGYVYFGDDRDKFFAWFVAQPSCEITAALDDGKSRKEYTGQGYHDHNWSNVEMNEVINHWYWCRATVKGYTIIVSDLIAEKKYGYSRLNTFFLGKEGEIIKVDQNETMVERAETYMHEKTKKFMDNKLTFKQKTEDGGEIKIEFIRRKDISVNHLIDVLPIHKKLLVRMVNANPTYVRILGDVKLTISEIGEEPVIIEEEALWEQMHFGKNTEAIMNSYS